MARHLFDQTVSGGAPASTVTIYTDAACTTAADIQTAAGDAIADAVITPTQNKRLTFLGPDNVYTVYAKPFTDTSIVVKLLSEDAGDAATDEEVAAAVGAGGGTSVASTVPLIGVAPDGTYAYWGQLIRVLEDDTALGAAALNLSWRAAAADTPVTFDGPDNCTILYSGTDLVPAGDYLLFCAAQDGVTDPGWTLPDGVAPFAAPGPPVATSVAPPGPLIGFSVSADVALGTTYTPLDLTIYGGMTLPDGWELVTAGAPTTPGTTSLALPPGTYSVSLVTFPDGDDVEADARFRALMGLNQTGVVDGISAGFIGPLQDFGDWNSASPITMTVAPDETGLWVLDPRVQTVLVAANVIGGDLWIQRIAGPADPS